MQVIVFLARCPHLTQTYLAISLASSGDGAQQEYSKTLVKWTEKGFYDLATAAYEEDCNRHPNDPAYSETSEPITRFHALKINTVSAPRRLPYPAPNRGEVLAKLRKHDPEQFRRVIKSVQLEHARRLLCMVRTVFFRLSQDTY